MKGIESVFAGKGTRLETWQLVSVCVFSLFSCSSVLDTMLFKSTNPQDAPIQNTLLHDIVNPLRRHVLLCVFQDIKLFFWLFNYVKMPCRSRPVYVLLQWGLCGRAAHHEAPSAAAATRLQSLLHHRWEGSVWSGSFRTADLVFWFRVTVDVWLLSFRSRGVPYCHHAPHSCDWSSAQTVQ